MAMWMVEYTYDDRAELRDEHRPAHRAYLASKVDTGEMLAFGRYDDHGAPGALLLIEAPGQEYVEELIANDPFVVHGLVSQHRVRRWAGTWGAVDAGA